MCRFVKSVLYVVHYSDVGVGLGKALLALIGSLGSLFTFSAEVPKLSIHPLGPLGELPVSMYLGSERHIPQLVDCLADYG